MLTLALATSSRPRCVSSVSSSCSRRHECTHYRDQHPDRTRYCSLAAYKAPHHHTTPTLRTWQPSEPPPGISTLCDPPMTPPCPCQRYESYPFPRVWVNRAGQKFSGDAATYVALAVTWQLRKKGLMGNAMFHTCIQEKTHPLRQDSQEIDSQLRCDWLETQGHEQSPDWMVVTSPK